MIKEFDKLKVKCIFHTPLLLSSNAIRFSKDNHDKSDGGEKDRALIRRVGVKMKHESVLEQLDIIYEAQISGKTLLGLTRHRQGVSMTVQSSRYTTSKTGKNIDYQLTETGKTKKYLERIIPVIQDAIEEGLSDDDISTLLPQAYVYNLQLKMNARSLRHFVKLRLHKDAHNQIRRLANQLLAELPEDYKYLFDDIKEQYET